VLIALILLWSLGEVWRSPLWTSFIAGLSAPRERGRWMALRATSAILFTIPVMIVVTLVVMFASRERALPFAYGGARLRRRSASDAGATVSGRPDDAAPPKRAITSLPTSPGEPRFLSVCSCSGSGPR
jgi:hypothetical protein